VLCAVNGEVCRLPISYFLPTVLKMMPRPLHSCRQKLASISHSTAHMCGFSFIAQCMRRAVDGHLSGPTRMDHFSRLGGDGLDVGGGSDASAVHRGFVSISTPFLAPPGDISSTVADNEPHVFRLAYNSPAERPNAARHRCGTDRPTPPVTRRRQF
jgi:hypothetical protein